MKLTRFLFSVGILTLLGAVYAAVFVSMHSRQTKTLPKKIIHFPNRKDTIPIFFIKKLKYKKDYEEYVGHQLNNRIHEHIKFPYQNGLGDLKDSILVEFYCPKYHDQVWGLRTGYVHRALIHDPLKLE